MTKTHKHQHTIPRVYLSSWQEAYTPPGQKAAIHIVAKETKEVRRKSPTKSFTSNDRYTVHLKDGERNLDVENYLGRIESDFYGVLQAVRNRQNLSVFRRAKLAVFTAAMMGRAPVQSDSFRRQLQPLEEIVEKAGTPEQKEELSEQIRNHAAYYTTSTIEAAAPMLFNMASSILITNDATGFITSDNPAVMFNPNAYKLPPSYRSPGLATIDIEITLPLTAKHLIVYTHRRHLPFYQLVDLKAVDELNRRTWAHAHQEVVSKTGIVKDIWSQPGEPPKDAWTPESDPILSKQPKFSESIPAAEQLRQSTLSHEYWRSRTWLPPELLPKWK
jgi:Protein of unknown function (DUF4238)